jgi:hypothetical protein
MSLFMLGLDFSVFFSLFLWKQDLLFFVKKEKKKKKKREGVGEDAGCSLQVFQLSHIFSSDISVHCALIEYDYI